MPKCSPPASLRDAAAKRAAELFAAIVEPRLQRGVDRGEWPGNAASHFAQFAASQSIAASRRSDSRRWGRHSCLPGCRSSLMADRNVRTRPTEIPLGLVRHGAQFVLGSPERRRAWRGRARWAGATWPTRPGTEAAANPKNRSISRSVTQSYFAPPMPWMNRSPRANRAQSVVTSARGRIRTPASCSSMSRSTARPASPSGVSGSRASHDCRSDKAISPAAILANNRRRRGSSAVQTHSGASHPWPIFGQIGRRMRRLRMRCDWRYSCSDSL